MPSITGIFGLMGAGKTMLATRYAKKDHDKGKIIYCNYHLKTIDYQAIRTLEDIQKMRNCTAIFDELWLWLFARTSQSNINKEIMKIIFLNRKRNVEIYYTAQLSRTIDVLLREATQYFAYPFITKPENSKSYHVGYYVFDKMNRSLTGLNPIILKKPLEYWGQYYDTTEEIEKLEQNKNENPLEKGLANEIHFCKALEKIDKIHAYYLIPNSGKYSPWKFDVIARKYNQTMAIDVKSSNKQRVTMDMTKLKKQIKNAEKWGFIPYIAFPMNDKKMLTNPKFWYLHHLTKYDYLLNIKGSPAYNKLVENSTPLTEIT